MKNKRGRLVQEELNPHGQARSVGDGIKIAAQSTDSGAALKELEGLACFSHA
jgi:anthranilate phosphoribosyltransferase